jgi:hypothetical protein
MTTLNPDRVAVLKKCAAESHAEVKSSFRSARIILLSLWAAQIYLVWLIAPHELFVVCVTGFLIVGVALAALSTHEKIAYRAGVRSAHAMNAENPK